MKNKSKKQAKIEARNYEDNTLKPNKTPLTKSKKSDSMSMNEIVSLAWGVKEDLRGEFKKTEWGKIILPFILLRRLGRALAPTKDKVLSEYEKIKDEKQEYVDARLNKISGYQFHNHSNLI